MAARQTDLRLYLDVIPDPAKVGTSCMAMKRADPSFPARNPPAVNHGVFEAFRYHQTNPLWHWESLHESNEQGL